MAALEHLDPATATFEALPEPTEPVAANDTLPGADTAGTPVKQDVSVEASLEDFPYVVAAARPTSVSIDTAWQPNAQTLTVPSALDDGTQYTVTSTYVNPTAAELRQVPMPAPTDFQEAADYPATDYPAAIRKTALTWTRGKTTLFDKVLAIQDALRSPGWNYNTNVSYPSSPAGVTEFLNEREGFCQQYATAMALLLRSINIPARVVIGFTAGSHDQNDATLFHVSTSDIHSWVEVPFEGYGWLTFEPTPGNDFVDPSTSGYLHTTVSGPSCPPGHSCLPVGSVTPPPLSPTAAPSGPNHHHLGGPGAIPSSVFTSRHRTPYPLLFG